MSISYNTYISPTGLTAVFDAANTRSYPGTGTTWADLAGGNYNATLNNSPTFSSSNGGFFTFNGTNTSAVLTRPVQDDFSLCCWFQTTQSAGTADQWYNGRGLVDGEVGGTVNDFGLSVGAGKVMFGTGNTDVTAVSTNTYSDNRWHYAVGTRLRASGSLILYVDGASVATTTGGTQSLTSPTQLRIGSIQSQIGFFSGNISAVQIYNRVLSSTEVIQNFNALRSRYSV